MSSQPDDDFDDYDGLTPFGDLVICDNGFAGYPGIARTPVIASQVAKCADFLRQCRRTKWAKPQLSPIASTLKHQIERLPGNTYISTGATIVAAIQLGLVVERYGERNALIGVRADDVAHELKQQGIAS